MKQVVKDNNKLEMKQFTESKITTTKSIVGGGIMVVDNLPSGIMVVDNLP